jgi:hypothetical protein
MTNLRSRKTRCIVMFDETIRERGKSREIVMELNPYTVRVRLKGLRGSYEIPAASIYNAAVARFVAQKRAEKLAAKKARGK